jgi:hypothetical protein
MGAMPGDQVVGGVRLRPGTGRAGPGARAHRGLLPGTGLLVGLVPAGA